MFTKEEKIRANNNPIIKELIKIIDKQQISTNKNCKDKKVRDGVNWTLDYLKSHWVILAHLKSINER